VYLSLEPPFLRFLPMFVYVNLISKGVMKEVAYDTCFLDLLFFYSDSEMGGTNSVAPVHPYRADLCACQLPNVRLMSFLLLLENFTENI